MQETEIEKTRKGIEAQDTGGDTEIEKARKGIEGRRYRVRVRDREDKKGN